MTIKTYPISIAAIMLVAFSLLGASCAVTQVNQSPATNTAQAPAQNNVANNSSAVLNLNNKGLTKFPMYIVDNTEIEELSLSHNKLEGAMPAEIRHLTNLRKLNISYNQFTGLPAELGQLKNLETLDVSYNQLTGLPYELGNLTNLKHLVLTGNAYSEQDLAVILKTLPRVQVVR